MNKRARPQAGDREIRRWSVQGIELRAAGDGVLTFTGHAAIFDSPYEMYGGPPWGWIERVDPGAFDKTLREKPDVQLLVNHEGLPLARTKSSTLRLATDNIGLGVAADLLAVDPDVARLAPKMERKDIDEMSFAFRDMRPTWNEDYTERTLVEVNLDRGDVSVVNYGANQATSADLRSLLDIGELRRIDQMQLEDVLAEIRANGADDPLVALRAAHDTFGRLLAAAQPPPKSARSLVSAQRLAEALSL